MAIITGTALIAGTSAVTAATVAAGVGFAASAATTAVSLNQAKKQRDAQVEAEDQADKALASQLKKNHVASPAPHKPPPSLPIPIPAKPSYSTYRKSIWNQFK